MGFTLKCKLRKKSFFYIILKIKSKISKSGNYFFFLKYVKNTFFFAVQNEEHRIE